MTKRLVLPVLLTLVVFSTVFTTTTHALTVLVNFPTDADTWSIAWDPYMWHAGDYIEGTRNIGITTYAVSIKVHVVLSWNNLVSTGHVDINVYLNNVLIGEFTVLPDDTAVDTAFVFTPIVVMGVVTIKYLETNEVDVRFGSITIDDTESTVELSLEGEPVVGGEILPANHVQILAPCLLILTVAVGLLGSLYKKQIP